MDSASLGRSDRSRLRQAIGPLNGPTARGTVLQWAVLAATVLAAVIACEAPAPTAAPNALAHFRNHTGRALLISLDSGTFRFTQILLPCAGELSVAVPHPPEEDPRVVMGALQDPALDVMAAGRGRRRGGPSRPTLGQRCNRVVDRRDRRVRPAALDHTPAGSGGRQRQPSGRLAATRLRALAAAGLRPDLLSRGSGDWADQLWPVPNWRSPASPRPGMM